MAIGSIGSSAGVSQAAASAARPEVTELNRPNGRDRANDGDGDDGANVAAAQTSNNLNVGQLIGSRVNTTA